MSARRAAPAHRGLARAALACAALVAALSGCASSRPLLASHGDYAAYRATRVSRTLDERLAAASAYLERYPDGAFAGEVRVYLARAEPAYYASKRGSAAGLTAYLAALPRGAFSADARFRLGQLIQARNTGDLLSRAAQETEARLAKERAERERVRDELTAWLRRFLDSEAWGRPLAQAPAEVVVPFSLTLPAPTCAPAPIDERAGPGALVCSKRIELPFTVKAEGEAAARAAQIEIAILEDAAGRPIEVAIRGPELFTRLEEARSAREVAADDPSGRIGGISLAVELARAVFQDHVSPEPSCSREVVAPVVLHLECGGARLVARAATDAGDDDALTIAVEPPAR
ncbi:hypothetical protein SOCE26_047200 [Sorangium cellulosum]|uniref:Secreted protein n=1 Tax=Sorangium cellulosum TaxID=56 RepID=A0A2L0EVE4_SORCE|nr:hypothetical protein [Sorangium cellulosum]AUX43276.1 hypothetical protein SOCE26_047200 [Sorangium cellulosum]